MSHFKFLRNSETLKIMLKNHLLSSSSLHSQKLVPHEDLRELMENPDGFSRNLVDSLKLEYVMDELLNEGNLLSVTSNDIAGQAIVSNRINFCNCKSNK